ncbi:MAG: ABC transporter permease [Cytophagales bacterium]|nr:ABC transporter permease [Cytophagales bacterium]
MVKSYLKVAIRNIIKYKFFSLVNLFGLTMGISAGIFATLYVHDELNYDRMHVAGDRIYRLNLHGKFSGQEIHATSTCLPLAEALVDEIPEVVTSVRLSDLGELTLRSNDLAFSEEFILAADPNFFEFFDFQLLAGNAHTVLTSPHSIVLSQAMAKKYFGDEPALGKVLSVGNDKIDYLVTGIMANVPGNSHLKFKAVASSSSFPWMAQDNWLNNNVWTYYTLRQGAQPGIVDKKLDHVMERNVTPVLKEFMGKSLAEFRADGGIYEYYSMPLFDIHLRSDLPDEPTPGGDMSYVVILGAIGLFIVVIACINFMNLATAKSLDRAKEVGLRKTFGSQRSRLMVQFLVESMIFACFAALATIALVYILLPYFNTLSGKSLALGVLFTKELLLVFFGLILFVGLLAGSYPAFYMTSFNIVKTLKGRVGAGSKSGGLRSFLVTFQFWISTTLMICTAILFHQLKFIQQKHLGIQKEQVLMIENIDRLDQQKAVFKQQLLALPKVKAASYADNMLPGVNSTQVFRSVGNEQDHIMATYRGDYDHLKTLEFEMKSGRFFSRDFPSDSNAVIVNEAAVKDLGWDQPLEEKLLDFTGSTALAMEVVGVMKDFNFEGLKVKVRPLVLQLAQEGDILYLRFSNVDPADITQFVEKQWKDLAPGEPARFSFLDENFDALFRTEQRLTKVFTVFTVTAIFIACLGLFGLAAFTTEQRTKEIGVRKVLGASALQITYLVSKDFARLVTVAFLLAIFPAYYFMDQWLQDFANRVQLSVWLFMVPGVCAIMIAWITVSYQSYKASKTNPVDSLRYE